MQTFITCVVCAQSKPHHAKGHCSNCYYKIFVRRTKNLSREDINSKISTALKTQRNKVALIKSELTEVKLKELYMNQGLSMGDIAKQFHCSRAYILILLRKYGLQIRNKSVARAQAKVNGKNVSSNKINEKFFKDQTPAMAYVLGFIYSDGNIGNLLNHFSISQKEPEILYKIKDLMSSEHQIVKKSSQDLYTLTIGCKTMVNDLIYLGLTPNKSLDVKFPILKVEFYSHFVRGYFDGDGSIHLSNDNWRVNFSSGSYSFLSGLEEILATYANCSKKQVYVSNISKECKLIYSRSEDLTKIFNYIYDHESTAKELFLLRKYNLFLRRFILKHA